MADEPLTDVTGRVQYPLATPSRQRPVAVDLSNWPARSPVTAITCLRYICNWVPRMVQALSYI